jgi:hypothetical protein
MYLLVDAEIATGGHKAKVRVTGRKYAGTVAASGLIRAVCVYKAVLLE